MISRQRTNCTSLMPAFEYGHRSQEDTIAMPQTTGISRKASIPVALALSKQVTRLMMWAANFVNKSLKKRVLFT